MRRSSGVPPPSGRGSAMTAARRRVGVAGAGAGRVDAPHAKHLRALAAAPSGRPPSPSNPSKARTLARVMSDGGLRVRRERVLLGGRDE